MSSHDNIFVCLFVCLFVFYCWHWKDFRSRISRRVQTDGKTLISVKFNTIWNQLLNFDRWFLLEIFNNLWHNNLFWQKRPTVKIESWEGMSLFLQIKYFCQNLMKDSLRIRLMSYDVHAKSRWNKYNSIYHKIIYDLFFVYLKNLFLEILHIWRCASIYIYIVS